MKVSKLSLITLSALLCTQATMPMQAPQKSIMATAQKAGRIALKIGAGTAALSMYTLMGTAALTSLGITLGAVAAAPFLYYARYLKPKLAGQVGNSVATPQIVEIQPKNGSNQPIRNPRPIPQIKPKSVKKSAPRQVAYAQAGLALIAGSVVSGDSTLTASHQSREQVEEQRKAAAIELQAQLDQCNEQAIEWKKDFNRLRIMQMPRFEGPYQDMIGIYDGDLDDMVAQGYQQMRQKTDYQWQDSGCKDREGQLTILARKIAQDQMRLPKL